jgi:hypothetical protein
LPWIGLLRNAQIRSNRQSNGVNLENAL